MQKVTQGPWATFHRLVPQKRSRMTGNKNGCSSVACQSGPSLIDRLSTEAKRFLNVSLTRTQAFEPREEKAAIWRPSELSVLRWFSLDRSVETLSPSRIFRAPRETSRRQEQPQLRSLMNEKTPCETRESFIESLTKAKLFMIEMRDKARECTTLHVEL